MKPSVVGYMSVASSSLFPLQTKGPKNPLLNFSKWLKKTDETSHLICKWEHNGWLWDDAMNNPSQLCQNPQMDRAKYVHSSSGLIAIVVMTLFVF